MARLHLRGGKCGGDVGEHGETWGNPPGLKLMTWGGAIDPIKHIYILYFIYMA